MALLGAKSASLPRSTRLGPRTSATKNVTTFSSYGDVAGHRQAEIIAWPSAPANFLKHANRDADAPFVAGYIDNEVFLMGACAAYVELMRTPSREIMAFMAL